MITTRPLRIKRLCAAASVLAAFAFTASNAQAAASASATVSDVRVQLIDLDATDGITPGITFGQGNGAPASLMVMALSDGVSLSDRVYLPTGTAYPLGIYFASTYASATMLAGDALGAQAGGPGASVQSSASGMNAMGWAIGSPLPIDFTLTANTRMVVTATVANWAQASLGDTAAAYGSLQAYDMSWNSFANVSIHKSISANGTPWTDTGTSLQLSFDNAGPGSFDGHLKVTASAYSQSMTAVPEPQSAALLLAGLALLAGGASRRRSHSR